MDSWIEALQIVILRVLKSQVVHARPDLDAQLLRLPMVEHSYLSANYYFLSHSSNYSSVTSLVESY